MNRAQYRRNDHRSGARSSRSYGRGGNSNSNSNHKRRMFTKLIKDKEATLSNEFEARKFIEGMRTYENSEEELLSILDDDRNCGQRRIRDVCSYVNTNDEVATLLTPVLKMIVNDRTLRPLYRRCRERVLMSIFCTPFLLETLVELNSARETPEDTASTLCSFLLALAKAFGEARNSKPLRTLATELRERNDIPEAHTLCAVLLTDGIVDPPSSNRTRHSPSQKAAACWVTDRIPPGGRHSNDALNFRDISIIPTLDELTSEKEPWLPLANVSNAIIEDREMRLLDSNFRLLREDAISTIKANITEHSRPWRNARIIGVDCSGPPNSRKGKGKSLASLSFVIQMDARSKVVNWSQARSLPHSGIIALCRDGVPVRLATITLRVHDKKNEWLQSPFGPKVGVRFDTEDDFNASLQEMEKNFFFNEQLNELDKKISNLGKSNKGIIQVLKSQREQYIGQLIIYDLIEASQSFFSYKPILRALQDMASVPLAQELAHMRPFADGRPRYLPARIEMPRTFSPDELECNLDDWSSAMITEATSLDLSQAEALRHALTSRVALLQGPPGTGKTFMGALIAQIIRRNSEESILCVCYTNHALDQFLEHLLEAGETDIVRIGGRSKSEKLEGYQLRNLAAKKTKLDSSASQRLGQVVAQLHKHHEQIEKLVKMLVSPLQWSGVQNYLMENEPDYYEQLGLPTDSDDGFKIVGARNKKIEADHLWCLWVEGYECPRWLKQFPFDRDMLSSYSVWNMAQPDRLALLEQWRKELHFEARAELFGEVTRFNELHKEKLSIFQQKDLKILEDAKVIGATTCGAAQFREILSSKRAGVVIVEEAGEVFEAHILASLSLETKHLILIGDHKQLRPKAECYRLTTVCGGGYNLDCSLFERLVCSKMPSAMLEVQHRMRPIISEFIRVQTYPSLKDHSSVEKYPSVSGVKEDVVFIDHDVNEDGLKESDTNDGHQKTKSNSYEAKLCVELVRFFLLQGYSPDQIVVLTPYVGQLLKIVNFMKKHLSETTAYIGELDMEEITEGDDTIDAPTVSDLKEDGKRSVRCASVDNFQGEEADIVIISLVRSNSSGNIGFLKEEQRVNVLLSRARHGLFIVGNSATLRASDKGSHVWGPLLTMIERNGQLRRGLPTFCQLHPDDDTIELSEPGAFRKYRPNGGCSRPCSYRMSCGHACSQSCHPIDRRHRAAERRCCEPCRRFPPECEQKHRCPKLCKDPCGPCTALVHSVILPCGHAVERPRCHDVRNSEARDNLADTCREMVEFEFKCGHKEKTECFNSRRSDPVCPAVCATALECGHQCLKGCGSCKGEHVCIKACERILFCGHICNAVCHEPDPCGPCERNCTVQCIHSKCPNKCFEPCAPCIMECDWQCDHQGKCNLVCGAPCTRMPCDERCSKRLGCGHRCPSICGETCPTKEYCQQCCDGDKKNHVVDMICFTPYSEHKIDEDPVIVLPCGHFYAASTLDGHLDFGSAYEKQENGGRFAKIKPLRVDRISSKPSCCPDCRAVMHSVKRYGRLLHFAELHSLERKHIMDIDRVLKRCERDIAEVPAARIERVIKNIKGGPMNRVYEACGGSDQVEIRPPPSRQLIQAMQLLAQVHTKLVGAYQDEHYEAAVKVLKEALGISRQSESHKSGCFVRLKLVSIILSWHPNLENKDVQSEVCSLLDWIINHQMQFVDLIAEAKQLKQKMDSRETIAKVVAAMNVVEGYNYGGSWSSHWYECPNGHPYFIGDCGRAMQRARCLECGAVIGGSSHSLEGSNRQVQGIVGEVLAGG